jgi:hypothetical protein
MRESNGTRNLGHRQIVASQQLFRALDFTLDDMLVQGHSHRLTKQRVDVGTAGVCFSGDFWQAQIVGQAALYMT